MVIFARDKYDFHIFVWNQPVFAINLFRLFCRVKIMLEKGCYTEQNSSKKKLKLSFMIACELSSGLVRFWLSEVHTPNKHMNIGFGNNRILFSVKIKIILLPSILVFGWKWLIINLPEVVLGLFYVHCSVLKDDWFKVLIVFKVRWPWKGPIECIFEMHF